MESRNRQPTDASQTDDQPSAPPDNVYRFPGRERDDQPEDSRRAPGSDVQQPDRNGAQIPDATIDWNAAEKQGEPGQEPPSRKPGEDPELELPSGY